MFSAVSQTGIVPSSGVREAAGNGAQARTGAPVAADLASTLILTTVLAFAGAAALIGVVMSLVEPQPVPGGISARQEAETVVYLGAFGLLLPVALYIGPRLSRVIRGGPNGDGLSALTALLAATLASVVVLARLADLALGEGLPVLLVGVLLWWVTAAGALARAVQPRPWPGLRRVAGFAPLIWAVGAVLLLGAVLSVAHFGSVSPIPIVLGAALAGVVLWAFASGRRLPDLGRRWRMTADALVVVVLLLAIPDLVIVTPEAPEPTFLERLADLTIAFHQEFLLAPANQVLGGSSMLVDVSSQYGVGSIYLIAGWFQLFPIGYGTLGLLDGVLTALYFVGGFLILRISRVPWSVATAALVLGVLVLVYNRLYPVGSIVQEGPLRFGLPLALILALAIAARWPRHRRTARAAAFAILGLSSVWSIEMFAYTAGTLAVMLAADAYLLPRMRLRWFAKQAALGAVVCLGAHLLFGAVTLIATGALPDWSQYLVYLEAFLFGEAGETTYDFAYWSPGLAVGAGCLASALTLGLLLRLKPHLLLGDRVALTAITGTTAYGVLFFSYFVNRSAPHVLIYVCLPVLLAGVLWLSFLLRRPGSRRPSGVQTGALAFALCVALLLVTGAWSRLGPRFEDSALAYAIPGVKSARNAVDRLKDFPRFDPRSLEAQRLLERYMPGERRSLVLLKPGLDIETLMHSGRSNDLPLPNAIQYSFVGSSKFPMLRDAASDLVPGRRLLVDQGQLDGLARFREDPSSLGPLTQVPPGGTLTTPLQVRTLAEIEKRFRLRPLYDRNGFAVVELQARG